MTQIKVGTNSNAGRALQLAFLWWLGLPEALPRMAFPRDLKEMVLECNRQRGSDLEYMRENYGYIFGYANEGGRICLWNIAMKAALPSSVVQQ